MSNWIITFIGGCPIFLLIFDEKRTIYLLETTIKN